MNEIVQKFLKDWKNSQEYLGAVLTGSRATGTSTEYSDIDLLLVLKKGTAFRERGNKVINGIVLEYIAYPVDYWFQLLEEEIKKNQRMWMRMWRVARIVDGESGELSDLLSKASEDFDKPVEKLTGKNLEMAKYQLWDGLENLKDLSENDVAGFFPAYYLQLSKAVGTYSQYLGVTLPAVAKWAKYFRDENYRKVYGFNSISDVKFVELALEAMGRPEIENAEKITSHVLDKLGGFQIDGWKLREDEQNI